MAKTLLVRTLARALDVNMARIQFTPDLLPSDITGVTIYDQKTGTWDFHAGPIFSSTSWPTRSTGPAPRPSRPSWRSWKRPR